MLLLDASSSSSWQIALGLFAADVLVIIPVSCHMLPGPMTPGSRTLIAATLLFALITLATLIALVDHDVDPYPYSTIYALALMVLCVEVWFREDPQLINGSRLKGFPLFIFHQPGAAGTKATVPMASYTRVFGAWHAGGVCLCFFMHVLANDFPLAQKAQTSLALGLLWVTWGAINQWRSIYGAAQFCQMGIMFHSLTGLGCGLCGYWMLAFWYNNRTPGSWTGSESVLLGSFSLYVLCAVAWFVTQERKEATPDTPMVGLDSKGDGRRLVSGKAD